MKDYDVGIIGGGLLGSAFAWGLADRGLHTVAFDEGDNAIRTARGNFGLVWVQGKGLGMSEYARWTLNASREWVEFAERLKQETGIDTRYHRCGGFVICLDDEEFDTNLQVLETLRAESGEQGYDYRTNLNDEDIKALDEERSAFFKATEGIRQDLYSKQLELRSELYKENPDTTKAGALQKEISELESELDQKRIDHMIKVRKLSPNAGRGFMMGGYHMGYGNASPGDSCW